MSLHKVLVYVAFGWLAFAGTMHFLIDVLAQYLRHKRVPGPEKTLYYGLNTAYALGQVLSACLDCSSHVKRLRCWESGPHSCSVAWLRRHGS